MGASISSPSKNSKFSKSYHLDNFATARMPTSKSTIGFRDKHSNFIHNHNHNNTNHQNGTTNSNKSSFMNSLSLKRLNLHSNKKKNNNNHININNSKINSNCPDQSTNINGGMSQGSIPTIYGSVIDSSNYQAPQVENRQPAAPIHQHTRINSGKNLTKSLSCYTLRFNPPTAQETRKTVIHASTSELLKCLGYFVCNLCSSPTQLPHLQPESIISWIRALDRSLILQGWSEIAFINPANVVFLYMLLKSFLQTEKHIQNERELQCIVLTCLYIAYSYMGNEISYPLKPFLIDDNRDIFWQRCIYIMNHCSSIMLSLNANTNHFTEYFTELKQFSDL